MNLAVSTSQSHIMMHRRKNVWYSVCDGNWEDSNIWISNALDRKLITVPQPGDDVYINHTVNFDGAPLVPTIVNNLFISGKLTASNNSTILTVNGNLQATGYIDFTGPSVFTLNLNGVFNSIISANFTAGNSTINYGAPYNDQPILNLPYKHLSTSGSVGTKFMISDLTINGNLNTQSNFECGVYNLTVNGTSLLGTVGQPYKFTKNSSTGLLLFVGNVDFEGITDLTVGNPNVECRGGMTIHTFFLASGTGTFTFSTNNQTLNCAAYLGQGTWNSPIVVSGAITVTLTGSAILNVNSLNGTVPGSTFNNEGVLYIAANFTPMTTGIFNYNHVSTSTIGYVFNGSITLPQTSYSNLVIGGTGTKTQGGNTTVSASFTNNGSYECGGYNLSVAGSFTNTTSFTASMFCTITIGGFASFSNSGNAQCMDLRNGNANVEFKNGLDIHAAYCYTGTGIFKFSTNNQALSFSAYNFGICAANFLISGAITVTFTSGAVIPDFLGTLNGDNASSTFDNRGTFAYTNATAPMVTGKLYCNQATNTFNYDLAGNQDITVPSDPTLGYKNLTLSGSGTKRLLGNVSVKGTYTLSSPATFNSNGFSLTNP
jgi:hypothetical protein